MLGWLLGFLLCLGIVDDGEEPFSHIDSVGYAWEDGGFPHSVPGDSLHLVGVVDRIHPRFGIDLIENEVTFWITGLVSTGVVDQGGGILRVIYGGGTLELWQDPSRNADFGIDPPNATAPSTFRDGSLLLGGALTSFCFYYDIQAQSGAWEAEVDFTRGSALPLPHPLIQPAYSIGVVSPNWSGGPHGYDLQLDASLGFAVLLGAERRTWGAVKSLYRP